MNRILQSFGIISLTGILGYQVIAIYGLSLILQNGYYAFDDFLNYYFLPGFVLGTPVGILLGSLLSVLLVHKGAKFEFILFGLTLCCVMSFYLTQDLEGKIRPPLVKAASIDNVAQIKTAIRQHLDLDVRDINGQTALMVASYLGNLEIVQLLAQAGSDINVKDNSGLTALMLAIDGWGDVRHLPVVQYLVRVGADIDAGNVNGVTALMIASEMGDEFIVKLLLEEGANINALDNRGWTALAYSKYAEHSNVAEILSKVSVEEK